MTPEDFITIIVAPNVEAALAAPNDQRAIFAASAAVESLSSNIYFLIKDAGRTAEPRNSTYKHGLAQRSEAFDIIHAVAETQKHHRLTFTSSAGRPVTRVELICSKPHGWDLSPWGEMMWDVDEAIAIDIDGRVENDRADRGDCSRILAGRTEGRSRSRKCPRSVKALRAD